MARMHWKRVVEHVDLLYAEGTSTGCSDSQLLSRFAGALSDSEVAFEAIVQRHGPMVLEVCRRLLRGDHHAAEDAFQATFLVLARRAESITVRPAGSLGPWLHEVACRTAVKARVSSMRRDMREQRAANQCKAAFADGHDASDDDDDYRVLHEEIARLPDKYRSAVVLCYFEGLTHDEAARSLHWPVGTVRGYLARARELLRGRLIRRGVAPAVAIGWNSRPVSAAAILAPPLVHSVLRAIACGSAASTITALTGTIVRGLAISRACKILFGFIVLALGAGWVGLRIGSLPATEAAPKQEEIAVTELARKSAWKRQVDLYGDALPDGAVARMGTNRYNNASNVGRVAFVPDGKAIISDGGDGMVRVWEATTGKLLRSIGEEESRGSRLFALSPDGKRLVTAEQSPDGIFRLWDFETGRGLRRAPIPEPRLYFSLMSYSPDGKTLATALFDNAICFRDVETFGELRRMKVDTKLMRHIVFSPDGRMLAGTSEDTSPHFGLLAGGGGPGRAGVVGPDASEKASIRLWDVTKSTEVRRVMVEGCHPTYIAFSPDGKILAAPFCDATIRFFDPAAGNELARMKVDGPMQGSLVFSSDGKVLASGDDPEPGHRGDVAAIHIWDIARQTELRRFSTRDEFGQGIAFSRDGKRLASAIGKMIHLWDSETGREINTAPSHRSSVACLVVSPTDSTVITGGYDSAIRKWDPATGRELAVIAHSEPVYDLAISPDGRFLLSSTIEPTIHLRDMIAGQDSPRVLVGNPESRGRGLAFSQDGRLATASGKIWEVLTGRELASLLDEKGASFHPWAWAAFTPDATGLVATDGGTIWHWDVAGGRPTRQIARPGFQISSIALSPDGRFLAAGVNRTIRLWHLASGREVKQGMEHDEKAIRRGRGYVVAAFSRDGRLLVSGSGGDFTNEDRSVRVWELASCREVRRLDGHRAGIYAVAFFPDGHRIATASADATALVWDIMTPEPSGVVGGPIELERLWSHLGEDDAARSYRAIWAMVADPDRAIPFLAGRLKPIESDDPNKDTSLGPIASGETLRLLRAIAVLEKAGTPEARRVLERLASGLESARETRDAKASLRRLGRKS